eukprot:UC1_evm1s845
MAALGVASPLERHPQFADLGAWALAAKRDASLLAPDMMSCRVPVGNDKLNLFNWANQFLQTESDLEIAAHQLCTRLRTEHTVVYCEVRFCPTLHTLHGCTERAALEAVARGVRAAGLPGGGVIVCALRTLPSEHWHAMAKLAVESEDAIGFDVAGYEPGYALAPMAEAIKLAIDGESCG